MFREMRRFKNQMNGDDAIALLERCEEGVLGTISENGYPYTTPINFVYYHGKIYFHSAKEGHKIDNIIANNKVSFTVYDNVNIIQETFTTKYQSVILFGTAKIVSGNKEILNEFIKKYSIDFLASGFEYVKKNFTTTDIIEITIEHLTGKERL